MMQDCTYFLFDACKASHPYIATEPSVLRTEARLKAVLARLGACPKEYQDDILDLQDTLDILAYEQAHHAFTLGLDLGMSMARELGE